MTLTRYRRLVAHLLGDEFYQYRTAAITVTFVGIALSISAFFAVIRQERDVVRLEFEQNARNNVAAIKLAVELGIANVEGSGALFDLGQKVTSAQFRAFGQRALRRDPALKAVAWTPIVPGKRREAFEAGAQAERRGFRINERDAQFHVIPAKQRDEYFPIYYSEDIDGVSPFGFDTASTPSRRELLSRARRSGDADVTGKFKIQTGVFHGQFGIALVRPVYRYGAPVDTPEQRHGNLVGFTTSIFVVRGLINNVLERVGSDGVRVALYDNTARAEDRFLAVWPDKDQQDPVLASAAAAPALQFAGTIDAGSRRWTAVMTPMPGKFNTALTWRPWAVLGGGLLFSLLLVVFLEFARLNAQRMREQAITDPLTGLYNRRYLWEFLKLELARTRRKGTPVSAVMLDIDHFKHVNDTHGHDAGDTILRELGALLRRSIRTSDVACRYGGEEFALLIPEAPIDAVRQRAEAIRLAVKNLRVSSNDTPLGPITISLGIAAFPLHAEDMDSLLLKADKALYDAKHGGRDRVVIFAEKKDVDV